MNGRNGFLLKMIVGVMVALVVGMATIALNRSLEAVDRDEIRTIVEEVSPYVDEREFILDRIDVNRSSFDKLEERVERNSRLIEEQLSEISVRLARIEAALENPR
jgi:hypothetical protein